MDNKIWEVKAKLSKSKINSKNIIDALLVNRDLKTDKQKKEFFNPTDPQDITLSEIDINKEQVEKSIKRIKTAIKKHELIIVYGDYDADGVCATAVLWETLDSIGANVKPYIPDRFSEGYGLNSETIKKLKSEDSNLGLIITVDNGIVADKPVLIANELGINVIITDHHEPAKKLPEAYAIVHTTKTSGSGVSWFFAREILKSFKSGSKKFFRSNLELVAIGTVADQLPLLGINRSLVTFGIKQLHETKRPGLVNLISAAGVDQKKIGMYEIGFVIAPRINSAGRLAHAIDSLRLVCTPSSIRALKLANQIDKTNTDRQKIVEEVVALAKITVGEVVEKNIIVIANEGYHEGVIGLAASRLVEVFYRPSIVISKGEKVSKASARSISGFSIIDAIRAHQELILEGGGHTMAAGFSIQTSNIDQFIKLIEQYSQKYVTSEMLQKKLKIDLQVPFSVLNFELAEKLEDFEPTGIGNPSAVFCTKKVNVVNAKALGKEGKHLKLVLSDDKNTVEAIAFGYGPDLGSLINQTVDIAYNLEINVWNGSRSLQLKIRDIILVDGKSKV